MSGGTSLTSRSHGTGRPSTSDWYMPKTSRAPLRLVGDQRSRSVQDARRHQPAGARLQAIGLAVVEDAVVALVPALQAAADVLLGRAGLQAEEGVGEVVADGVQLRWKIVRLRFTLLTDEGGLRVALVHVMRDRPEVVEELAVDGPALIAVPDGRADQSRPLGGHGVAQGEGALALVDDVAEAFVRRGALVGGRASSRRTSVRRCRRGGRRGRKRPAGPA